MYLIDTMVLSELRRRQRDPGVVAWIARQQHDGPLRAGAATSDLKRVLAPNTVGSAIKPWNNSEFLVYRPL